MSSDYYQSDERESTSRRTWLKDTHEARRLARDLILELPGSVPANQTVGLPQRCRELHKAIIAYADCIRPKHGILRSPTDDEHGLWTQPLTTVRVPQSGVTHNAGHTDAFGEYDLSGVVHELPREEKVVSLETVSTWWATHNQIQYSVEITDGTGDPITEPHTETVHLPPRAAKMAYSQLNDCLEDLGWLPEASTKPIESEPLL